MDTLTLLLCLFLLATLCACSAADDFTITAAPAPELDALFSRADGWIGADGDYSVALSGNRIAWLFSDTFVGKVKDGKRVDTVMINNSVAIQKPGTRDPVRFYYSATPEGKPKSFITPNDSKGHFWLFDAAQTSKGLYMFLIRVQSLDIPGGFPFKLTGMSLGHLSNPDDAPDKWNITQRRVPFSRFTDHGCIWFGSATLHVDNYIYIYGVDSLSEDEDGHRGSNIIAARVREDQFGDFAAWRFWSGGKWGSSFERASALFTGVAAEFSVSYVPAIKRYAAVYTAMGISGVIEVRLAATPEGPWSEPIKVFECPDRLWHKATYSYAAKAHPELSAAPDELIVTYATNSTEFSVLFSDARLYWPRFLRLKFVAKGAHQCLQCFQRNE